MQKRSSKGDFAQNALRVVEISTGHPLKPKEKNPAAVALGRLGGIKGGTARAAKLNPEQRREIAQRAAKQRWAKEKAERSGS
jgi:hypothetical protein